MKLLRIACFLFALVSINILSAENFTVWDTFPMKDGSSIIIVHDRAKTVLKVSNPEATSCQVGDLLVIDDLYNMTSDVIEIENKNSGELTQTTRIGALWKKQDGCALFQITEIIDWGPSLIIDFVSEKSIDRWNAKIYVNQKKFKKNFHPGDVVYIVNSFSVDWPNYIAMLEYGRLNNMWWSKLEDCFINIETKVSSQWFYSWDPYF